MLKIRRTTLFAGFRFVIAVSIFSPLAPIKQAAQSTADVGEHTGKTAGSDAGIIRVVGLVGHFLKQPR